METFIVVSKLKKFVKDAAGMNTSANFIEPINKDLLESIDLAIEHAQRSGRKTVMGKDFNLYVEDPKVDEVLVVASKVKKYIKDKAGFSTSSQVFEQLTNRLQTVCHNAIQNAQNDKRKTVMDRDFSAPTTSI